MGGQDLAAGTSGQLPAGETGSAPPSGTRASGAGSQAGAEEPEPAAVEDAADRGRVKVSAVAAGVHPDTERSDRVRSIPAYGVPSASGSAAMSASVVSKVVRKVRFMRCCSLPGQG